MVYEQNIKQDKYKEEVTEALNKLSALQDKDVCTRQAIVLHTLHQTLSI